MKLFTTIILWLLKGNRIEGEERAMVINMLLKNIGILPLENIITFEKDGTVKISGNVLEPKDIITLRQGATQMRSNWTRRTLRNQMKYEALMMGIIGNNTEQIIFAKAVNWILLKEEELLEKLDVEQVTST